MTKIACAWLVLAFASANFALGDIPPRAEEDVKREAAAVASSNQTAAPTNAQLTASTRTVADLESNKMVEPAPAFDSTAPTPAASSRQNIWWFIVGALAALAALWWFSRQQAKPPK